MKTKVSSLRGEIAWRCALSWTAAAVKQNILPEVYGERLICDYNKVTATGAVSDHMAKAARVAREALQREIEKRSSIGNETLRQVITSRGHSYCNLDKDFGVELSLLDAICGQSSEARLKGQLVAMFPTPQKPARQPPCKANCIC